MQLLLRHKLLIAGAVIVAAASAGGAYAATQSNSNPQKAYLNDVAKRLGVSPARLDSALKGALNDRLNAMVKAGQLTRAQANRIENRLEHGGRLPLFFGGPGFGGPGPKFGGPGRPFLRAGVGASLKAATSYLGLSNTQLLNDLRSGQSLAQIANKQGKSVSGLEQALITAEKTRLDKLVSSGVITATREQKALSRLSGRIDKLVNRTGLGRAFKALGAGPGFGPMKGAPRFAPGPGGAKPPAGGAFGAGPASGPPPPTA